MIQGDSVRVSVTVSLEPAAAFAIFTGETDLWWRRGPKFRPSGRTAGVLSFEPATGGRLFESFDSEAGRQVVVMGTITVWEPGRQLSFEWRGVNFAPGESTLVDVRFEPVHSGTRVTVTHSGWAALRADHPVRHGQPAAAFIRNLGLWWGELLTSLREYKG
ncbi:MAG: SRPBCC domain-containing protein [Acidobacteria bacterium]|nr:SRPBCC domain-containing protein [Acidobacteriota bacterium]